MNSSFASPAGNEKKELRTSKFSETKAYYVAGLVALVFHILYSIIESIRLYISSGYYEGSFLVYRYIQALSVVNIISSLTGIVVGLIALIMLVIFFKRRLYQKRAHMYFRATLYFVIVEVICGLVFGLMKNILSCLIARLDFWHTIEMLFSIAFEQAFLVDVAVAVLLIFSVRKVETEKGKGAIQIAMVLMLFGTAVKSIIYFISMKGSGVDLIGNALSGDVLTILTLFSIILSVIGAVIFPVTVFIFVRKHEVYEYYDNY